MSFGIAATTFWTQFWPALASGAIASLLTGALVGIALQRAAAREDEKRTRRGVVDDLVACLSQIEPLAKRADQVLVDGARLPEPSGSAAVAAVVTGLPLERWRTALPGETAVELLTRYAELRGHFIETGWRTSVSVAAAVRASTAARNIDAVNDHTQASFAVGRLLDVPASHLQIAIGLPPGANTTLAKTWTDVEAAIDDGLLNAAKAARADLQAILAEIAIASGPAERAALVARWP